LECEIGGVVPTELTAGGRAMGDPQMWEVLEALQPSLVARDVAVGFSSHGLMRLLDRERAFLEELGLEAIQAARRAGNHEVQPIDVDRAEMILRSKAAVGSSAVEVFGSLIWGVAAVTFVQEATARHARMWLIVLAVIALVFTTMMVAYGLLGRRLRTPW
jgi:hypothetical protein